MQWHQPCRCSPSVPTALKIPSLQPINMLTQNTLLSTNPFQRMWLKCNLNAVCCMFKRLSSCIHTQQVLNQAILCPLSLQKEQARRALFLFLEYKCIKKPQCQAYCPLTSASVFSQVHNLISVFTANAKQNPKQSISQLNYKVIFKRQVAQCVHILVSFIDKKVTDWTPPPLSKCFSSIIGTEGFGTMACTETERK